MMRSSGQENCNGSIRKAFPAQQHQDDIILHEAPHTTAPFSILQGIVVIVFAQSFFLFASSHLKDAILTFYLVLFLQLYWKKSRCRWCVVGKWCFDAAILLSHDDGSMYIGVLGCKHQDVRVLMEASGWQLRYGIMGHGDGSIQMELQQYGAGRVGTMT